MAVRPSLTSLSDRMAKKAPAPPQASELDAAPSTAADLEPKGDKRVQILVRMTPAERKALRQIALDQDTTVQALVEESIRDLLSRHGISQA